MSVDRVVTMFERTSPGLRVRILFGPDTGRFGLSVRDGSATAREHFVRITPGDAQDAFEFPFAYLHGSDTAA